LQNEYKQAKTSLKEVEAEINLLHSRKRKLQRRCDDLQVQIEVCQSNQVAAESSRPKWSSESESQRAVRLTVLVFLVLFRSFTFFMRVIQ